jgi:hypothetical protein
MARILYPLDVAYTWAGVAPPTARPLTAVRVPTPYRALLDHERDMTGTLERHFDARLIIRVMSARVGRQYYLRRVLLAREDSGRPVAMCAARVRLGATARMVDLGAAVRASILRGQVPLGRVLLEGGHRYVSRPTTFMAVTPNPEMLGVFWMRNPQRLYGRQTEMTLAGARLGDIVEILAPI